MHNYFRFLSRCVAKKKWGEKFYSTSYSEQPVTNLSALMCVWFTRIKENYLTDKVKLHFMTYIKVL